MSCILGTSMSSCVAFVNLPTHIIVSRRNTKHLFKVQSRKRACASTKRTGRHASHFRKDKGPARFASRTLITPMQCLWACLGNTVHLLRYWKQLENENILGQDVSLLTCRSDLQVSVTLHWPIVGHVSEWNCWQLGTPAMAPSASSSLSSQRMATPVQVLAKGQLL